MPDIYDQHRSAFARVSAFVTLKDGEAVGTVSLKHPADGAGRLYAYCHVYGTEMARGSASGFGYDKTTPAVVAGFQKAAKATPSSETLAVIADALAQRDGYRCHQNLEDAGFTVLQVL